MNQSSLIEYTLLTVVLLTEVIFWWMTRKDIIQLRQLFPAGGFQLRTASIDTTGKEIDLEADLGEMEVLSVQVIARKKAWSAGFLDITNASNAYLRNNKGSVIDFENIKQIAESVDEAMERNASANLAVPLYIGLMGTMASIVIGLFSLSMPIDDEGLGNLLGAVKIAMIGSVIGLFLTTINTSGAMRRASAERDKNKATYLNFIRAFLMPSVSKDISESLKALEVQLSRFNRDFAGHLSLLDKTLDGVEVSAVAHKGMLDKLDELGFENIVQANMMTFERLEQSAQWLNNLYGYAQSLSANLEKADQHVIGVNQVFQTVSEANGRIEETLGNLGSWVGDSREMVAFLKQRYAFLEETDQATDDILKWQRDAVNAQAVKLDAALEEHSKRGGQNIEHFSESLKGLQDNMKEHISDNMEALKKQTGDFKAFLDKYGDQQKERMDEVATAVMKAAKGTNTNEQLGNLEDTISKISEMISQAPTIPSEKPIEMRTIKPKRHNSNPIAWLGRLVRRTKPKRTHE